ncbi:unnamed protein product [Chrysoparadoxa australica]
MTLISKLLGLASILLALLSLASLRLYVSIPGPRVESDSLPDCHEDSVTTTNKSDLVVPASGEDYHIPHGLARLHTHGVAIFENAMSPETAAELRAHIVERNAVAGPLSKDFVHEPGSRTHLLMGLNEHPIVKVAVQEVLNNNVLSEVMHRTLGADPSIVEHAAITSQPGAPAQDWHRDTVVNREDTLLYQLFIPLQNTTAQMGATDLCPGTHVCHGGDHDCWRDGYNLPGQVSAGDVVVMNSRLVHRGGGHTGYWDLDRVMYYMTFVRAPLNRVKLPEGSTYSLRWDQWGYNWSSLASGSFTRSFRTAWTIWDWAGQHIEEHQKDDDDFYPNQDDVFAMIWRSLAASIFCLLLCNRPSARDIGEFVRGVARDLRGADAGTTAKKEAGKKAKAS